MTTYRIGLPSELKRELEYLLPRGSAGRSRRSSA